MGYFGQGYRSCRGAEALNLSLNAIPQYDSVTLALRNGPEKSAGGRCFDQQGETSIS